MISNLPEPLDADPWEHFGQLNGSSKESFEGPGRLLPELEIFGWVSLFAALPGALRADRHEGMYEIHFMRRGHVRWWVEGETHDLSPGSIFIVKPGENHGGEGSSLQPCEHYWLRVRFSPGIALPGMDLVNSEKLATHFDSISRRNFPASPEVEQLFLRLHEEHRSASGPLVVIFARALLHSLLITIIRDHDRRISSSGRPVQTTWKVRRVMELLSERLFDSGVRVEQIAKEVGASPSNLRSRFRMETGYSIHEFLVLRRIEAAKARLAKADTDITTIAHDLGFSSSQYFATTFRRYIGMTPGQYRRNHGMANL